MDDLAAELADIRKSIEHLENFPRMDYEYHVELDELYEREMEVGVALAFPPQAGRFAV